MTESAPILVCFAVPEEARPFRRKGVNGVEILVTGMGPRAALSAIQPLLNRNPPRLVLTCGFAGALDPELRCGDVVYDAEDSRWNPGLKAAGARPARFASTDRVAVTAKEKQQVRTSTGAGVVEMESSVIRNECRLRGIPAATIRVISDEAGEELPFDFNALMTPDGRLSIGRLVWKVMGAPHRIPALMRLGKRASMAAARLAGVLETVCREF